MDWRGRSFLLWCCLLGALCGCAATERPEANRVPVERALPADVTGVWHGRTIADCPMVTTYNPGRCAAMQLITLTMFQKDPIGLLTSIRNRWKN